MGRNNNRKSLKGGEKLAENGIKTYEIFGFERIVSPHVVNIVESVQSCGYIAIGVPGKGELVKYCAGINIGKFCVKKSEKGDKAVFFMTYSEIMDLYQAIPQIIAEEIKPATAEEFEGKK